MRGYVGQDHQLASQCHSFASAPRHGNNIGFQESLQDLIPSGALQDIEQHGGVSPGKKKFGISAGKPASILDAMELASQAWDRITAKSIVNCFLKANCLPEQLNGSLRASILPTSESSDPQHSISDVREAFVQLRAQARVKSEAGHADDVVQAIGLLDIS